MGHEFSKRLLERANTFELRQKAVRAAMGLGMPLQEIEQYLDWLDNTRKNRPGLKNHHPTPPPHSNQKNTEKHD